MIAVVARSKHAGELDGAEAGSWEAEAAHM